MYSYMFDDMAENTNGNLRENEKNRKSSRTRFVENDFVTNFVIIFFYIYMDTFLETAGIRSMNHCRFETEGV